MAGISFRNLHGLSEIKKSKKKKNNKQNVLHGQLCQLTEHKLWSFRGFRQK